MAWLFPGVTRGRAVSLLVAALVVGAVGWWAPVSPVAMARADVMYGNGNLLGAEGAYAQIGQWHPLAAIRVDANLRAATIATVDLASPQTARTYLERVIATSSAPQAVRAEAWERLGHLEWNTFQRPDEAASAFQMAYELDMIGEHAARRLVLAARARTEAGRHEPALAAWERVARRVPSQRALARVSQASLRLALGDEAGALQAYEAAIASTTDPALLQVARLGMATCKERMGMVQAALADVSSADLPADVAAERERRLAERAGEL